MADAAVSFEAGSLNLGDLRRIAREPSAVEITVKTIMSRKNAIIKTNL